MKVFILAFPECAESADYTSPARVKAFLTEKKAYNFLHKELTQLDAGDLPQSISELVGYYNSVYGLLHYKEVEF